MSGVISIPLAPDFLNRPRQRVDYEDGKEAVTRYVMEGDTKGLGRRNVISSLKVFLAKTPLSMDGLFADADILVKESSGGNETIKLNSKRAHFIKKGD